ncbi:MAG: hypothetical protein ACYDD6_12535 [Acidimicrobiales bacterium]
MGNGRAFRRQFERLAGQVLPGGCDRCEAEQRLKQVAPGVFLLRVAHEDACPAYRAHVGREAN